jgi:LacI family transcriptional regulator
MHNDLTLKDIAKIANVSVATVSRVLNNLGGYSEETRKKVLKVIDEYGYRRNAAARNLKTKKSNTVAVLLPQVETTYDITILNGIGDAAQQNGYSV